MGTPSPGEGIASTLATPLGSIATKWHVAKAIANVPGLTALAARFCAGELGAFSQIR